jgi:translocation and assembly module TamB
MKRRILIIAGLALIVLLSTGWWYVFHMKGRIFTIVGLCLLVLLGAGWWYAFQTKRRIFAMASLSLLVLFGAGWWYVFHTEVGVNYLLGRVANLKTVKIVVEGASGTLAGPLNIDRLTIDHKLVHIVIDKLTLELSPRALFAQRLQVDSATAERVAVEVRTSSETDQKPPRFFPSFLELAVDSVDFHEVHFSTADGFTQDAKRVRAGMRLTAQRLQVSDILIDGPYFKAAGSLAVRARRPIELQVDTLIDVPAPRGPDLSTRIALSGPIPKLHLSGDLLAPSTARFDGDIVRGATSWQLLGDLTSAKFLLNPWMERPAFSLTDLAVKVDYTPAEIHVYGNVTTPELDSLPLAVDLHGRYASKVIAITRGELRPTKSDTVVVTAARIDLTEGKPVIAATSQWTDLHWPLRENYFVSPEGQLSVFGSMPFTLGINADVRVAPPGIGELPGHLVAHGELSDSAIEFDAMTLGVLDGEIKGAARLGLTPKREWRVAVTGANLNPEILNRELPGRVDFNVAAYGAGLDRKADFAITLPTLKGTLRGERLNGRGYVSHDGRGWSAKEFTLSLGQTRLAANGEWRENINLAWSLEVPALERFVSGASGSIRFNGTAHGSKTSPQVAGSLVANKILYGDWNVASINAAGNIDLSDRLASLLNVDAQDVGFGERRLKAVTLKVEGKATGHTVKFSADLLPKNAVSTVTMNLQGSYDNNTWRGQIEPIALADDVGRAPTAVAKSATASYSKDEIRIDELCALWIDYKACAGGGWTKQGGWRIDAQSDSLPLSAFNGTFPEGSHYQGQWQVSAHLIGTGSNPWTGTATVQVNDASLTYQPIAGAEETVRLGTGRVDASAETGRFVSTLKIVTPGTTNIDMSARIDRTPALDFLQAPFNGELRAHTADANLLPLFLTDLDHSAGELDVALTASGSLSDPRFQGQIDLQKGELDLYRYNLSMRDLGSTAKINDNKLAFDGRARLGKGSLAMNGNFEWRKSDSIGTLHLEGENLLVADLPEYRIVASPNVDFKIDGKRVDVRGEVVIPSAHIEPTDLRGAVQASNDVRLVGDRPDEDTRGFDVHSEVRVRMGDDVRLVTYGLQGKLGGAVTVITGDETAIGRGELNVSDGKYEAYGQKLEIEHGRLLFDASPIDNPGLDIQAEREIEEWTVGVNVRGTLRAPRVYMFSEPALPQSQIVSMLLTGKPIADLSTRDTTAVGAAQNDLRLQGGSVLASQIGRRLGLEEVGVESTGLNDTSLVLGKFLSPRLFVSYGISLTESINTLKMRYTLSKKWRVKAEAGQNQSADVEYRIER